MNEAQRQAAQLLTLPDQDYFAFDEQRALAAQLRLAALFSASDLPPTATPEVPQFVALGAPRQIDLDRHAEWPLLMALHYTGQREWEVRHQQNVWLLAVELNSGAARLGRLFNPGKRELTPEPSRSGNPPDAIDAGAVYASVQRLDLRRAMAGDWQPGRFAVTVIFYDLKSNTVVIELQGEGNSAKPLPIGQPSPFLTAIDAALTPAIADGAALTRPSGVGRSTLVNLTFDLPRDHQLLLIDREKRSPLLKASLLLLRLDDPWPTQMDFLAPIHLLKPASGAARLQGAVQLDLRAAAGRALSGAYQAYLLAGDRVIGPWPLLLE